MSKTHLVAIGGLGVGFGSFALYLGYDGIVIGAVFSLLGMLAGYLVGKKT